MAGKIKTRPTLIRAGMSFLGWFHYAFAFAQLLLGTLGILAGVHVLGVRLRAEFPDPGILSGFSDTALGVFMVIWLVIGVTTQCILGWIWHRKARTTANQMLAMVLSGGKIISAVFAILSGGILNAKWANYHALILNAISFSLAFWLHREYSKTRQAPGGDKEEGAGDISPE